MPSIPNEAEFDIGDRVTFTGPSDYYECNCDLEGEFVIESRMWDGFDWYYGLVGVTYEDWEYGEDEDGDEIEYTATHPLQIDEAHLTLAGPRLTADVPRKGIVSFWRAL